MITGDMELGSMITQCTKDSNRWFPGKAQSIANQVLCMAGEVGEVANLIKKVERGSITLGDARVAGLEEEIVDVLIYLCNLMGNEAFEDTDWEAIWNEKRRFNESRFNPIMVSDKKDER